MCNFCQKHYYLCSSTYLSNQCFIFQGTGKTWSSPLSTVPTHSLSRTTESLVVDFPDLFEKLYNQVGQLKKCNSIHCYSHSLKISENTETLLKILVSPAAVQWWFFSFYSLSVSGFALLLLWGKFYSLCCPKAEHTLSANAYINPGIPAVWMLSSKTKMTSRIIRIQLLKLWKKKSLRYQIFNMLNKTKVGKAIFSNC